MGLVRDRNQVLEIYREAASRHWVIPEFNTENRTCTEAILSAHQDWADNTGIPELPVCIGITNRYFHRAQTEYYTHTGRWDVGLRMFLSDLEILTAPGAPFEKLRVMIHLDHIQWDSDKPLFDWDMGLFSSIMYDASVLSFEENIRLTREFYENNSSRIVIEGACDEIKEATEDGDAGLTTPEMAERYCAETGVDIIVANLGTEHRANASNLTYHSELAREISGRVGRKLCLHGTSSVSQEQVRSLFDDGVVKVNIWTALERDSSPALLADMAKNAGRVAGPNAAQTLKSAGVLGPDADVSGPASLDYYTTTYRQGIVFKEMKRIVTGFLERWLV